MNQPAAQSPGAPRGTDRVPAPLLFVGSGVSQYVGAALGVGLFAVIPAMSVSWWRIGLSAVVLLAWRRPWRARPGRRSVLTAALFGVVLAAMNLSFYLAIEHLPLGTAVAIEFLGPVAVAAITGRSWRERVGIVLAAAGVVLLAGVTVAGTGWTTSTVIGLAAIAASGLFWAGYILLGRRVAVGGDGISGLAVGMTAGSIVFLPFAFGALPALTDGTSGLRSVALLLGVAVFSSVLPYTIDQWVLPRMTAAQFAILLALLPVSAAVVGAVMLHQLPTAGEVIGTVLVCLAIAMANSGRGQQPAATES
ncbi:EamA family transporter [Nakamurella aerolata]|uniref:EamA family transporter n=1 Tax=Nakamurella aerolata TaxID=1656892 RepID=UPI0031B582CA